MNEESAQIIADAVAAGSREHRRLTGEEFKEVMGAARKRSAEVKSKWAHNVANRIVTFDDLIRHSMNREDPAEARYVSGIFLFDILKICQGWDDERAYEAMVSSGIDHRATVAKARISVPIYDRFSDLVNMDGEKWEPRTTRAINRPPMPEGWPWRSKIDDLYRLQEAQNVDPTTGVIEETSDEQPQERPQEPVESAEGNPYLSDPQEPENPSQSVFDELDNHFTRGDNSEQKDIQWEPPIRDEEDIDEINEESEENSDEDDDLMRDLSAMLY